MSFLGVKGLICIKKWSSSPSVEWSLGQSLIRSTIQSVSNWLVEWKIDCKFYSILKTQYNYHALSFFLLFATQTAAILFPGAFNINLILLKISLKKAQTSQRCKNLNLCVKWVLFEIYWLKPTTKNSSFDMELSYRPSAKLCHIACPLVGDRLSGCMRMTDECCVY